MNCDPKVPFSSISGSGNYLDFEATTNESLIRVGIPSKWAGICPCAYNQPLPSPKCRNPGFHAELSMVMAKILGEGSKALQIVDATGFSLTPDRSSLSILDQMYHEKVDLTALYRAVTPDRIKLFNYATLAHKDSLFYVYKSYDERNGQGVSILELFTRPLGYWFLLLLMILLRFGLKRIIAIRWPPASFIWIHKLTSNVQLVSGLFLGIILSALASHLFWLFTKERVVEKAIETADDLLTKLADGSYQAIVTDQNIYRHFFSPNCSFGTPHVSQFAQIARINPPLFMEGGSLFEIYDILNRTTLHSTPQYVYIAKYSDVIQLRSFEQFQCQFQLVRANHGHQVYHFEPNGVFWRRGFAPKRRQMTHGDMLLLHETMVKLARKYYPFHVCMDPKKDGGPKKKLLTISPSNLLGVLLLVLCLYLMSFFILLYEISLTTKYCSDRLRQKRRFQDGDSKPIPVGNPSNTSNTLITEEEEEEEEDQSANGQVSLVRTKAAAVLRLLTSCRHGVETEESFIGHNQALESSNSDIRAVPCRPETSHDGSRGTIKSTASIPPDPVPNKSNADSYHSQ